MKALAILLDDSNRFSQSHYFLKLMVKYWREKNWRVILHSDFENLPNADLALLHIDSTVISDSIISVCRSKYEKILNGQAVDISKSQVSHHLLQAGSSYSGPVIIKTNANCGGRRERYNNSPIGLMYRMMDMALPWTQISRLSSGRYPIYPDLASVPESVWQNEALVVERLCCERRGELYALRQWVFFGDQEINKLSFAKQPVVKADNVVGSELIDTVPEQLRWRRRELGFDYGKFDYVIFEGRPILFDANRTPTYGRYIGDAGMQYADRLSRGINSYL